MSVRSFLIAAMTPYSRLFLLSLVTRFACDSGFPGKLGSRIKDRGSGIEDQGSRIEDRGSKIKDRGSNEKKKTIK